MDIYNFLRGHGSPPNPSDEILYEFVAFEITSSSVKKGLWTKALSDADWDENKAKSLYVKMRISQLRRELHEQLNKPPELLSKPHNQAKDFGLSEQEIEYLGTPIKAVRYIEKYGVSKDNLAKAIGIGKIRGVLCNEILWVQDKEIS